MRAELPIEKPKNALTEPAPSIRVNKINVRTTVEFIFIADKLLQKKHSLYISQEKQGLGTGDW
ncbi:hypothetical protein, partial [Sphaerospermopsis aphanizomenoides]|uniref:hypothetical protein n=1 Tax=Sphaerospermopsis aphanizomenoides TaxID=459663 RepID=UPI001D1486CD